MEEKYDYLYLKEAEWKKTSTNKQNIEYIRIGLEVVNEYEQLSEELEKADFCAMVYYHIGNLVVNFLNKTSVEKQKLADLSREKLLQFVEDNKDKAPDLQSILLTFIDSEIKHRKNTRKLEELRRK